MRAGASLLRRKDPRMKWAMIGSIAAHVLGIGGALLISRAGAADRQRADHQPIVAKLVRLGEVRDPKLLPRKDKAPPPPKPTAALPVKPDTPPKPTPKPPDKKDVRQETPERTEDLLAAAVSRIADEYDPNAKPEPRAGSPDGDPFGDALDGAAGDRYLALISRAVRDKYRVPSIIGEKERLFLNAVVVVYVAADGRIVRREIEKPSGNEHFDAALLRAVDAASPLPPPPTALRQQYLEVGVGLRFKI